MKAGRKKEMVEWGKMLREEKMREREEKKGRIRVKKKGWQKLGGCCDEGNKWRQKGRRKGNYF